MVIQAKFSVFESHGQWSKEVRFGDQKRIPSILQSEGFDEIHSRPAQPFPSISLQLRAIPFPHFLVLFLLFSLILMDPLSKSSPMN